MSFAPARENSAAARTGAREGCRLVAAALLAATVLNVVMILVLHAGHRARGFDPGARRGFARGFLAACGSPCEISLNGGGIVADYEALAAAVLDDGRAVVIDGPCASACALFADLARTQVCIMPNAAFGFHRVSDETPPPDGDDIASWVARHGGYPPYASGALTVMDYDAAQEFFRPCCQEVPGPAAAGTFMTCNIDPRPLAAPELGR